MLTTLALRTTLALLTLLAVLTARASLQQHPKFLEPFKQLVPTVFTRYLKAGTPLRHKAVTMLLKEGRYFGIHPKFEASVAQDEELMTKPFFWTDHVLKLFGGVAVEEKYPTLNGEATVYYEVIKLCLRLLESRQKLTPASKPATPEMRSLARRVNTLNKNAFLNGGSGAALLGVGRPRGETAHLVELNASIVKQSSEVRLSRAWWRMVTW